MIQFLKISNYALIESVEIKLQSGFTVITGETGAGKSILLGALSLLLGKRADTSVLRNPEKKCTAEAHFNIKNYRLHSFFQENELDYDDISIIRREILPSGRSRAFINDTPVNLNTLKGLSHRLVDIHSQHKNIELGNPFFQLTTLDAFAELKPDTQVVSDLFSDYNKTRRELQMLKEKARNELAEHDYLSFLYNEFQSLKLKSGEIEELEAEAEVLNNSEEIKQSLSESSLLLSDEDKGILSLLKTCENQTEKIARFWQPGVEINKRIESVRIELEDVRSEIEIAAEDTEFDPQRADYVNDRLDKVYALMKKHRAESTAELLQVQKEIAGKLRRIESYDEQMAESQKLLQKKKEKLKEASTVLSQKRKKHIPEFEKRISGLLHKLSMPDAVFKLHHQINPDFSAYGIDQINYLFSANKNTEPQEIEKIASGGEISRLMLSIKSVIAGSLALPTIIFDEIDTGISGEIAAKTAAIMKRMAAEMQVIDITHLPQVAALADHHLLVHKNNKASEKTQSMIRKLNRSERIDALAAMLSGTSITDAARKQAEELLKT